MNTYVGIGVMAAALAGSLSIATFGAVRRERLGLGRAVAFVSLGTLLAAVLGIGLFVWVVTL